MFSLNLQSGIPIYEQLVKRVSELVISGSLLPDDKMPTIREVAKNLGVNPNTVQKAYQILEHMDLIYSIPGKGSYVKDSSKSIEIIKDEIIDKFKLQGREAIRHGITKEELKLAIDSLSEQVF
ncbi:MAG: GntR family transcriptional regulator [Clostridiales bacterium]|nr:GntR family transcriptional regulator [Clostridiales bacterium]